MIFFMGDNGTAAPIGGADVIKAAAPLRGKKASCWEGGTRVPFIADHEIPLPTAPNEAAGCKKKRHLRCKKKRHNRWD